MAQQTAVEWLIQKLKSQYIKTSGPYDVKIIFGLKDIEQAKQMEKEQIIKSYKDYHDLGHIYGIDAEKYYNETYNK